MGDELFNIDVVRDYIASKGGKVKNHDIVTHFKTFLNDPKLKASNRQKFKTFVNTLVTVKLDETGEKVLMLKKKFRDDENNGASSNQQNDEVLSKLAAPKAKLKDTFPIRQASEDDASGGAGAEEEESLLDTIQRELVKSKIQNIEASPVAGNEALDQNPSKKPLEKESVEKEYEDVSPVLTSSQEPNISDDQQVVAEESNNSTSTDDVQQDEFLDLDTKVEESPVKKEDILKDKNEANNEDKSLSVPEKELISTHDSVDNEPQDEVSKAAQPEETKENVTPEEPLSVKDRAKHLNKITSQTELSNVHVPKKLQKKSDCDGESLSSINISLDPIEKEWMIASAKADYQHMAKLLNQQPQLAKRKNFATGFTGLHWAAKHGQVEVVKMLCGAGAPVNTRTNGGYTALHLASMHGNEQVIELLVQTYGADSNMRDFSGKKAKQYLNSSASSHVQQLLQARRSSQRISFKRTGSYSAKIGTAGHFGIKANTAMRTSWADTRLSLSRSPSQSPQRQRKSHNSSEDVNMMPPPKGAPLRRKRSQRNPDNLRTCSTVSDIPEDDVFLNLP